MTIAREGWPMIGGLFVGGGLLLACRWPWAALAAMLLAGFTAFFFRDPERRIPGEPGLVVAPADGKVVQVVDAPPGHALGAGTRRVSIFLSIFDVHINRAPIGGVLERIAYHPGEFLPAFDHKASARNEQNAVTVAEGERRVEFKQIAGLIARRIVFRKRLNDSVARGERVGLIKFGSRVDVFLPKECEIAVSVGDRVQGGASVLARWP